MQIEIIGNGGREHALAWKLTNENCTIEKDSDFVIIGPEVPIAQGLVAVSYTHLTLPTTPYV